jgi:hypothetical protein
MRGTKSLLAVAADETSLSDVFHHWEEKLTGEHKANMLRFCAWFFERAQ